MGDLDGELSEDCLTLTVWAPTAPARPRPVIFWLHGGAFLSGGGSIDWYDGTTLCREGDVVVVSPNYRLGALGFLYEPGLSPGNLGLGDAELALSWVVDHIARFGGDADRITVMGQSAGGWLACLLAARMPADRPSIHQLILHSAPLGITPAAPAVGQATAQAFLDHLGTGCALADQHALARSADVSALLSAQDAAMRSTGLRFTRPGFPAVPFGPIADAQTCPVGSSYAAHLARAASRVPVLIGWTRDEMNAFTGATPGAHDADLAQSVASEVFSAPALAWAGNTHRAGKAAYVFAFDWAPAGNPIGACHCIDLPLLFGNFAAFADASMLAGADRQQMCDLSRRMRAAWLAFVVHGDPNAAAGTGLPHWDRFTPDNPTVLHLASIPVADHATPAI